MGYACIQMGRPRPRSDSYEARSIGSLDPKKSPTRTTQGRPSRPPLTHLLTDKAFNATTSTNVATAPPTWERHLRLILLFTAHPGTGDEKQPLFPAMTSTVRPSYFRIFGARPYPFPIDPPRPRPDLASTTISRTKRPQPICRPRGNRTSSTTTRISCRPVINITTTPLGWPACTGARRHSNTNSARPTFSSKASPMVCRKPYPPLESIKGRARSSLGTDGRTIEDRKNKIDISPTSEINISINTPLYSFFET
jgi:hypothetical protein